MDLFDTTRQVKGPLVHFTLEHNSILQVSGKQNKISEHCVPAFSSCQLQELSQYPQSSNSGDFIQLALKLPILPFPLVLISAPLIKSLDCKYSGLCSSKNNSPQAKESPKFSSEILGTSKGVLTLIRF